VDLLEHEVELVAHLMLDAWQLSQAIHQKQVSCREVMQAYLDHIEHMNPLVNAIISLRSRDVLMAEAQACDDPLASGRSMGWMHGFPHGRTDGAHCRRRNHATRRHGRPGVRATPGVLIVPFENEFHWSRATISFAIGINLLVYGLVGPFAAAAMDRFGVRRTMALSLALAAAGVALSPLMYNPWQLVLLWGLVVGLSTGFVGAYLAAYIAARW
jgi:hypothetical protein